MPSVLVIAAISGTLGLFAYYQGMAVGAMSIVAPIGVTVYWFAVPGERVHKFVHFFLMRADGGDVSRHDHEYDDVRWVPARDARGMLSYETYREMLERAIEAARAAA